MKLFQMMGALLLLVGCSQNHVTDSITAGIYELTVEREVDGCSPTRAVGSMGPVAVLVRDGSIDAPVPELADTFLTAPRVTLDSNYLHAETNRRVAGCESAWVHEEWTVIESANASFELLHTQRWQGLDACELSGDRLESAPASDCMSERRLRYDLNEVCAEPCRLRLASEGGVACSC